MAEPGSGGDWSHLGVIGACITMVLTALNAAAMWLRQRDEARIARQKLASDEQAQVAKLKGEEQDRAERLTEFTFETMEKSLRVVTDRADKNDLRISALELRMQDLERQLEAANSLLAQRDAELRTSRLEVERLTHLSVQQSGRITELEAERNRLRLIEADRDGLVAVVERLEAELGRLKS